MQGIFLYSHGTIQSCQVISFPSLYIDASGIFNLFLSLRDNLAMSGILAVTTREVQVASGTEMQGCC